VGTYFIDVCGGPGAFTQLLLRKGPKPARGYGITLRLTDTPSSDQWYANLKTDKRFSILYGKDDTGSVYHPDNLNAVHEAVVQNGDEHKINIIVADGGFEIHKKDGRHMENLQELFSGRIVLSEILLMLQNLNVGGHFVCKMFDTFSKLSVAFIYVIAKLFEDVYIIKPVRSRIVNSERYLVGRKRRGGNVPETDWINLKKVFEEIHKSTWSVKKKNIIRVHLLISN